MCSAYEELIAHHTEPVERLSLIKYPAYGYTDAFNSYFPARPTGGRNVTTLHQYHPVQVAYAVLWHTILTGEYPKGFWGKA